MRKMDFNLLLNYLSDKYVIIGAYALRYYGYLRNTSDLDILVDWTNEDFKKFEKELKKKNIDYKIQYIAEEDIFEPLGTILTCYCGGEIQLIQAKYNYQKEALKNPVLTKDGLRIINPEFLALLKLDAHGFKDIEDLKYLVSSGKVDLNQFCKILSKYKFDRRYSKLFKILNINCDGKV